jgi:hypothetical protein
MVERRREQCASAQHDRNAKRDLLGPERNAVKLYEGVAVPPSVARPGVVDRDMGAGQARKQHGLVLRAEYLQLGRQQPNGRPFR